MSVQEKHIIFFGSSTMAKEDVTTDIGGPENTSIKMIFEDLNTNSAVHVFSDESTDSTSMEVIITGRNSSGELVTENIVLDGHTAVASSSAITFERLIMASVNAAAERTGNIAVMSQFKIHVGSADAGGYGVAGDGDDFIILSSTASAVDNEYQFKIIRTLMGTGKDQVREIVKYTGATKRADVRNWLVLPTALAGTATGYEICDGMVFDDLGGEESGPFFDTISVDKVTRPFYNAAAEASGGSQNVFVDKIYAHNLHTSIALTNATISEIAEGVATDITFALAATLNEDSTNYESVRTTTGALGLTQTWSDGTLNIANSQNFSTGSGQAVWIRLELDAGVAATNSFYKMQISGQSI